MNKYLPTIAVFLLLLFSLPSVAQDNATLAKSEYLAAERAYGQGEYEKCLGHLEKSEQYIGMNRLIQYLKVKSYYNLMDYKNAKDELTVFFDITDKKHTNTDEYSEMVALIAPINEAVERQGGIGGAYYSDINNYLDEGANYLTHGNTRSANRSVFKAFKIYEDELKSKISINEFKIAFSKQLNELISIASMNPSIYFNEDLYTFYSEVVEVGNQIWMGEEILVNTGLLDGNYNTINDDMVIINDFNENELPRTYFLLLTDNAFVGINMCPAGYRMPNNSDIDLLSEIVRKSSDHSNKMFFAHDLMKFKFINNWINFYFIVNEGSVEKENFKMIDIFEKKDSKMTKMVVNKSGEFIGLTSFVFDYGYIDIRANKHPQKRIGEYYSSSYYTKYKWLKVPQGYCKCIKE